MSLDDRDWYQEAIDEKLGKKEKRVASKDWERLVQNDCHPRQPHTNNYRRPPDKQLRLGKNLITFGAWLAFLVIVSFAIKLAKN